MDILELIDKTAAAGRIKPVRVKDLKSSARQYIKILGQEDITRCSESTYAISAARRKEVIEAGFPDASLVKVRNIKNNLAFLFRNAEELGLIRLKNAEPLKKRAVLRLGSNLPPVGMEYGKRGNYFLRPKKWPVQAQAEYEKWERWVTGVYVPGRSGGRLRLETVRMKKESFARVAGFVVNIQGREFQSMAELADPDLLQEFARWFVESEGEVTHGLTMTVKDMAVLAKHYLKDDSKSEKIRTIRKELGSPIQRKDKDSRRVNVADLISAGRSEFPNKSVLNRVTSRRRRGLLLHPGWRFANQAARGLAIMLLATRPLRQKNYREAVIGKHIKKEGDNWVLSFSGDDKDPASLKRKMRSGQLNVYKMPVPAFIVPYLEEYLELWRPLLNCKKDDHLFLKTNGKVYGQGHFGLWIQSGTYKWLGKRVNPHLFRDIVATEIINETGNYVAAATLLNDDPATVFKHYWHLDQQKAAQTADDWLAQKMGSTASKKMHPSPRSEGASARPIITPEDSLVGVPEDRGDETSQARRDVVAPLNVDVLPQKTSRRPRARSTDVQKALEQVATHLAAGKPKKAVSELCQRYRIWTRTEEGEIRVGKHGSHKVLLRMPQAA